MLKVLIAPSAFKGTFSPVKIAHAIEQGITASGVDCQLELAPLADGGDGTLESLHYALGGQFEHVECHGPTGKKHTASWLQLPELAVIELANACGLALIAEDELVPLASHTQGLGEVIADCLSNKQENIVVTLGGSASTDGGSGALKALGARFLDVDGNALPLGGGFLRDLVMCDLAKLPSASLMRLAVDVKNPLLGATGAARVFAHQKGASPQEIADLELGLRKLADVLEEATGRKVRNLPGSGAAGGTAFGFAAAFGCPMISGFHWLADMLCLEDKIRACDLVISAEGRLDAQTLSGKAVGELGLLCKKLDKKLAVVAGSVEDLDWASYGISDVKRPGCKENPVASKDISETVSQLIRCLA